MLLAASAYAQTAPQTVSPPASAPPGPESTLSVAVRLVGLTALVRDKKGELIHGLTKDDFELREDGRPQPIRYFNTDSDLPLLLGLMVDTSGSMLSHAADEQAASAAFLDNMLTRPQDRAFLVRFDRSVLLLQGTTSDVWQLKSALWMLADPDARPTDFHARRGESASDPKGPQKPPQNPSPDPPPDSGFYRHGGTLLFDGIAAAALKVIGKEPGRRALIVLTDGDDNGSRSTLDDTVRAAQNADVAVYSILYVNNDDDGGFGGRGWGHGPTNHLSGEETMQRIAQQTGGRCFVIGKQMPIAHIFGLIEQDMRSQYRIGFTPTPAVQPDSPPAVSPSRHGSKKTPVTPPPAVPSTASSMPVYHTLELKTRDSHLSVQARTGYYAQP
jgi:VWFA-related protein